MTFKLEFQVCSKNIMCCKKKKKYKGKERRLDYKSLLSCKDRRKLNDKVKLMIR